MAVYFKEEFIYEGKNFLQIKHDPESIMVYVDMLVLYEGLDYRVKDDFLIFNPTLKLDIGDKIFIVGIMND